MFATAPGMSPVRGLGWLWLACAVLAVAVGPGAARAAGPDDILVSRDLPYGTDQGEELLLDVYRPSAAVSPLPIVVLIHGGGWVSGDKARYEPFARSLAAADFVVFDINYSLDLSVSPGYPRQVRDVHTALAWIQRHAEEFDGDTSRLAVAGGSAGGYLAAMLGTQANTSSSTPVRAVVSLSGPMDMVALAGDLHRAATSEAGQCAPEICVRIEQASGSLRNLLGCDPRQCPEPLLREASPITYVTSVSPPFFLANGTDENVPPSQATRMAAALRAQGIPAEVEIVPGERHSVEYLSDIRRPLLTFLTTHVVADRPAGENPATDAPRDGERSAGGVFPLRWIVVAVVLCLLAGVAVTRWRLYGGT